MVSPLRGNAVKEEGPPDVRVSKLAALDGHSVSQRGRRRAIKTAIKCCERARLCTRTLANPLGLDFGQRRRMDTCRQMRKELGTVCQPAQYGDDDDDVEVYVWNERLATYVFVPEEDTVFGEGFVHGGEAWGDFHLTDFSDETSSSPESIPRPFSPAAVTSTYSLPQRDLPPSPPLSPLLLPALLPTQPSLSPFSPHDYLHIIVEEGELDPSRRSPVRNFSGSVSGVVG